MAKAKNFQLSADTLGTEFVTIHVGPKRKTFAVHKKLLCDCSDFFSKAFDGGFKEAKEGVMYLPEDSADAFDSLINYLYQDCLPAFPNQKHRDNAMDVSNFSADILYSLFALAEKFCINRLANRVMDRLQDLHDEYDVIPDLVESKKAYSITSPTSKLRSYSILTLLHNNLYVGAKEKDWFDVHSVRRLVTDCPEFAVDYLLLHAEHKQRFNSEGLIDLQSRDDEEGLGRCFFHTHGRGERCHLDPSDE
ncbi:hypothetical protein VTL71DRAFT_12052 [Oculimacula yallundae]|uniref:BTB domain-containing protein n=1 Tax=Oculimacula yallundae TaxID=86028 RepID=A0ABR4CUF8_9HELO